MNKETTFQKILDQHLWKIFDQFRGLLSAESAFSLLLQLLFYKFLEDNREDIETVFTRVNLEKTSETRFRSQIRLAIVESKDLGSQRSNRRRDHLCNRLIQFVTP